MTDILFILTFVTDALWHVWPAFLLSVLAGVLIRALKLDGVIRRALSARLGVAIVLATVVGAISPFCSCTVVPVVSGLLLSGVPLAPVMAFWIASPTMDPEIFALSVATLGWPLALARLGATFAISIGAGYLTLALSRHGWFASPLKAGKTAVAPIASTPAPAVVPLTDILVAAPMATIGVGTAGLTMNGIGGRSSPNTSPLPQRPVWWQGLVASMRELDLKAVGQEVLHQSWSLGRWLVVAFVMEALILRFVPQEAIASVLGQQNPFAVPLAALIGVPLYLNNITALPLVSGLLAQGMTPGAAIAFLIAGPVTTIPAMTAVWGIARREVFVLYLGIALGGSVLAGFVANAFL